MDNDTVFVVKAWNLEIKNTFNRNRIQDSLEETMKEHKHYSSSENRRKRS